MEIIIDINNLSFTYMKNTPYEKKAIDNINIRIEKGSTTAIIGHTGSGKSTLVQHLNGLLKPQEGKVTVCGIDVSQKNIKELRKKVGLVFQYPEHQLFEETVEKDITFGLLKSGFAKEEISAKVKNAAKIVGLSEDELQKSPFELSGGQKRRAALAGVIVMEPDVLVLDEPAAGLDPVGRDEIFSFIGKYHKEQKNTVVLVSHSMEDVAKLADKVIVLDNGTVFLEGAAKEVFLKEDELVGKGLSVPLITTFMRKLKIYEQEVDEGIFTVDEAVKSIMDLYSKRNKNA